MNPDMVVSKLDRENKLPKDWKKEYEYKMAEIKAKRWEWPKKIIKKKKNSFPSETATVIPFPQTA